MVDHPGPSVRETFVAGSFYPEAADELRAAVFLSGAAPSDPNVPAPKAIIAPHAGTSIPAPLLERLRRPRPSPGWCWRGRHTGCLQGVATPSVDAPPLGAGWTARPSPKSRRAVCRIGRSPRHGAQFGRRWITSPWPLVVGDASPETWRQCGALCGPETLLVVS